MININDAKRMIKRVLLSNIVCEKPNLYITPLISGKHGIGKSAVIRSIADDFGGICITIDGGTLKEGEITGLPYQYKDESGNIKFRFLPYYAVDRIQQEEKYIFELYNKNSPVLSNLDGDENAYSMNNISSEDKIKAIQIGRIKPVILFIDEINRTENTVYKELMNILLTRSVNGYKFPWWVMFVGAMNPSTQNSIYATNEMDPAQLDRFLKIKVSDNTNQWLKYAESTGISQEIIKFITDNKKCLSMDSRELNDEDKPAPSPRGWDMVDSLLKSEPLLKCFFTDKENDPKIVEKDMKALVAAKLGSSVATMFFASLASQSKAIMPDEIFSDDENLSVTASKISDLSAAKKVQTCDLMLEYLKENIEFMMISKRKFNTIKKQLTAFCKILDSSTRLLFAQKIASTTTDDENNLIDLLFDVFESDLLETLDLTDTTRKLIEDN